MRTFLVALFSTFIHLMCCVFPLTLVGFNSLAFLDFSDNTKKLFLVMQAVLFLYLIRRLAINIKKRGKLETMLSILSMCLIVFSFYVNFFQPFHTEKQKLMQKRIERIMSKNT